MRPTSLQFQRPENRSDKFYFLGSTMKKNSATIGNEKRFEWYKGWEKRTMMKVGPGSYQLNQWMKLKKKSPSYKISKPLRTDGSSSYVQMGDSIVYDPETKLKTLKHSFSKQSKVEIKRSSTAQNSERCSSFREKSQVDRSNQVDYQRNHSSQSQQRPKRKEVLSQSINSIKRTKFEELNGLAGKEVENLINSKSDFQKKANKTLQEIQKVNDQILADSQNNQFNSSQLNNTQDASKSRIKISKRKLFKMLRQKLNIEDNTKKKKQKHPLQQAFQERTAQRMYNYSARFSQFASNLYQKYLIIKNTQSVYHDNQAIQQITQLNKAFRRQKINLQATQTVQGKLKIQMSNNIKNHRKINKYKDENLSFKQCINTLIQSLSQIHNMNYKQLSILKGQASSNKRGIKSQARFLLYIIRDKNSFYKHQIPYQIYPKQDAY